LKPFSSWMIQPGRLARGVARVLAGHRVLQDHLRRMLGADHGDLHAREGLDRAALVHAQHQLGRHQAKRQESLV
jgi:hypothetical protein